MFETTNQLPYNTTTNTKSYYYYYFIFLWLIPSLANPGHVFLNGLHVLSLFLFFSGIVIPIGSTKGGLIGGDEWVGT
jgi:hypothetical protein